MADENNKQWFQKDPRNTGKSGGTGKRPAARPDGKVMPPKKAVPGRKTNVGSGKLLENGARSGAPKAASPTKSRTASQDVRRKPAPDKNSKPPLKQKAENRVENKADHKAEHKDIAVEEEVNRIINPNAALKTERKRVDDVNRRRKNSRKRGIRFAVIALGVVAVSVMVLVFVVHHLFDYFAVKPQMAFISNGSVEHTIGAKALIVRDERLIASTVAGDLVTQATEGGRVSVGQRIAMVVPESMQSVVSNLRYTQSQISEVQQELIQQGNDSGATAIYDNINESLSPIIDMIRLDAMEGNLSDLGSCNSSISVLLNQREKELAELSFDDERLRVLRNDEAGYNSQLERNASMVTAIYPGVISFKLDGLESELNFDMLLDADVSVIRDYIDSSEGIITSDLYIEANENVARIANNERQYMAVYLDSDDATADAFYVGSLHTINVGSEGISIGKCLVERCVVNDDGMLVVFSTTHYVENLLDLRSVDIEIVITESTGLRVPVTSLVNPDYERNIATIYYNNQGFVDEVGVIIVDNDREFAIITPIGDSSIPNTQNVIITNPESTSPGNKVAD